MEVLTEELPHFLLRWLETKSASYAVINPQAALYWANSAASASGAMSAGAIEINDNMVRARRRGQQDALSAAIDKASSEPTTIVLAGDEGPTLVKLADVGDPSKPLIGIKWWLADDTFEVQYAELVTVFHLTPAEHSVLLQLTRGQTADEAATAAGISLQTVRSHIRQIYAKLNVRSREEMFFRIQPFRV